MGEEGVVDVLLPRPATACARCQKEITMREVPTLCIWCAGKTKNVYHSKCWREHHHEEHTGEKL